MDDYIRSNLSLVNRFSYIKVILGSKTGKSIFNGNLDESRVKNILKNISNLDIKKQFSNYIETTYSNMNEQIVLKDNNFNYYIVEDKNSIILDECLISTEMINKDKFIVPSINKYNNINKCEVMEFNLGQLFNVYIKKNKDLAYLLEIKIYKPNDTEYVLNTLKKIIFN